MPAKFKRMSMRSPFCLADSNTSLMRQGAEDDNAGASSLQRTGSNPLVSGGAPSGDRMALRRTVTDIEQQRRTVGELRAALRCAEVAASCLKVTSTS